MTPAGFLSVIPAAASNSRNRAAGSADNVTFSAIPIKSWTEREVERAGASDDVMGILGFERVRVAEGIPCWLISMRWGRVHPHRNTEPRRAGRPRRRTPRQ